MDDSLSLDDSGVAQRRRSPLRIILDRDWLLVAAAAFFVGVAVWFGHSVKDFFGPSTDALQLPAFTGQTISDVLDECNRLQDPCTIAARQSSDRFPRDVVMSQDPAAGVRVRAGRSISLIVSNGVTIFPMPDLRTESLRNAGLTLAHLKLRLGRTTSVANDDVPYNHVVSQDPPPLTSMREGSTVGLTLSKGPPSSVVVPRLTDMTLDAARDAAKAARIHLGQIVWTPFGPHGPARGTVVRQSPESGRHSDPFAPVSLQVSAGPTEYGYIIRQAHVSATIPVSDQTARVRMTVRDDTGTWNVYDAYAQGGAKIDLNVTAIGTATLDTYVDEELLNSTVLAVEPKASPLPKRSPR